jgi:F420-dependent oxidoreductase-like protein
MKTSISIGSAYYNGEDWDGLVEYTVEAEKAGVDSAWSAEAWGMDAIVPLAYIAARTEKIKLGTGIMQISSRVPSMIAMTAQSLDTVSNGRFMLGLGVSGPQVVEGLHGANFAQPLGRLKECIAIIKKGLKGDRIEYDGKHYVLPRPGGEGKPIRLSQPPRPELPLYLATRGPKSLELTGEVANGWLGTSFIPEHADIFLEPMARGAAKSGRTLADIDIQIGASFELGDDVDAMIEARKPALAFTLGAMGSAQTNFYNDAFKRAGYEEAAVEVQRLWVEGNKPEAIKQVPDEMVLKTNLIGTKEMIRERLKVYKSVGVSTLSLRTGGKSWKEKLDALCEAVDFIKGES